MSKIKEMELMGLRELTDAEIGFLMTTKNYAGALVLKFVAMGKDAAAIDMHDAVEAENLTQQCRKCVSKASLARSLQFYQQGKTLIMTKVRFGEELKISPDREVYFK